jgi:hypothetical protein
MTAPNMALQRPRRPSLRSGRSLRSLGSPLNAYPLGGPSGGKAVIQRATARRVATWCFGAALLFISPVDAQLFSRTTEAGTPVVIVEPLTGTIQRFALTGETSYSSVSGLDPVGRRIFVLAAAPPSGQRIVTIDLRTGSVTSAPLSTFVPDRPLELHFDRASQFVLAISNSGIVLQIDPQTGATRSEVGNFITYSITATAFDPVGRRLFAINGDPGPTLQILELDTGHLTLHPIPSVRSFGFLTWDPVSRQLLSATSELGVPIVSIDPSTGSVLPLFETGSPTLPFQSALDPVGRRLFFLSFVPLPSGGSSWSLYTASLVDRSVRAVALESGTDYLFLQFVTSLITGVPILGFAGVTALTLGLAVIGSLFVSRIRLDS